MRKFMVLTTPPRLAAPATLTLALALVLTLVPVLFTGGRDLAEAMTNPLYIASIAACVRQPCSGHHGAGVTMVKAVKKGQAPVTTPVTQRRNARGLVRVKGEEQDLKHPGERNVGTVKARVRVNSGPGDEGPEIRRAEGSKRR